MDSLFGMALKTILQTNSSGFQPGWRLEAVIEGESKPGWMVQTADTELLQQREIGADSTGVASTKTQKELRTHRDPG